MVKMLALLMLCVMLFAGGLGGALYFRPSQSPEEDAKKGMSGAQGDAVETNNVAQADLPVPMHGKPMSTDDVFRLTTSIRGRERELKRRQDDLETQESRLKLMEEDLLGQRREIDGKMQDMQNILETMVGKLQEIQNAKSELAQERAKAQVTLNKADSQRDARSAQAQVRIKQIAGWFEGLDEQAAAEQIKDLANSGEMEMAVQLLAAIEERTVAKVLGAVGDPPLVSQLMNAYMALPAQARKK